MDNLLSATGMWSMAQRTEVGSYNSYNLRVRKGTSVKILNQEIVVVEILDRYFLKVSPKSLDGDAFYLKPLSKRPEDPKKPWFIAQPVGKNCLNAMVKTMAKQAGIDKKATNHSLRAYGTTLMFDSATDRTSFS